jgi:hypothetical protein
VVDARLVVFLYLGGTLFPSHLVEDATVGDDLSLESVVDRLDF